MAKLNAEHLEELRYYEALLEYELALLEARDDLIRFSEIIMPDERYMDDPAKTKYLAAQHHIYTAELMMKVESGEVKKVILNEPPRHGKTQLCTKNFAAWISGRNPSKDIIVTTYNGDFAKDFGKEIRAILQSPRFRQVFPDYELRSDSKNSEHIVNKDGGNLYFLGRRSATTGRGGDFILVDDPTKDDKEVRYDTYRDDVWEWFTKTLLTRRHDDKAALVVTQTRWHEDDIVGRIIDPTNPAYRKKFSDGFKVIDLPAIAEPNDPLGRQPGEPLWPERFGKEYLAEMEEALGQGFHALYQSNPTPAEGIFYQKDEIFEYSPHQLPDNLKMFVVSDHAVSTKQINDPSCFVPYGVCENGNAYIMPDVVWKRMDSSAQIDEMIKIVKAHKPLFWFAEKGHISKSLRPFIRKRMNEEKVYCPIVEEHPVADKLQRAQSARARCAQGKILFPKNAPWWGRAKTELLKFPNGRFDDFVDCVSMIGLKLTAQITPGSNRRITGPGPGTFGHMLAEFRRDDRLKRQQRSRAGW